RKYGTRIAADRLRAGDYLAHETERGIVAEPLGPGNYRLNPYAYSWELIDAVHIRQNEVGVRTLKVGKDPSRRTAAERDDSGPYVVQDGYRGVQRNTISPGTHYLNPHVASIVAVDVASHPVEFTDIEFPSRDGF